MRHRLLFAITLAVTLASNQVGQADRFDNLLSQPEGNPCVVFDQSDGRVVLYIDMPTEGREIPISLPREYLEHPSDWLSGLRHGSVFFRMMVQNALPVRQVDAKRIDTTHRDLPPGVGYVSLLIGDFEELDSILAKLLGTTGHDASHKHFEQPAEHNLNSATSDQSITDSQLFTHRGTDQLLNTVIECQGTVAVDATCTHYIRSHSLDVVLQYSQRFLSQWHYVQSRVERFLSCARDVS